MSLLRRGRWDPSVHASLHEMIERHRTGPSAAERPLATLDWDNTMIRGDIGEAVLEWLDQQDQGGRIHTYERLCAEEGKPIGYPWCAYQVAGLTMEGARALARDVADLYLADGRIHLRDEMRDLVAALHEAGWEVWVVSASAEPLVQAFAERYGLPAERVIGMRLAIDEAGTLLPHLDGPNTFRQGKVDAIDQRIGRRPVFAAGDTETDLEMLRCAKHRLLMDRGDPPIRAIADAEGWWVQPVTW